LNCAAHFELAPHDFLNVVFDIGSSVLLTIRAFLPQDRCTLKRVPQDQAPAYENAVDWTKLRRVDLEWSPPRDVGPTTSTAVRPPEVLTPPSTSVTSPQPVGLTVRGTSSNNNSSSSSGNDNDSSTVSSNSSNTARDGSSTVNSFSPASSNLVTADGTGLVAIITIGDGSAMHVLLGKLDLSSKSTLQGNLGDLVTVVQSGGVVNGSHFGPYKEYMCVLDHVKRFYEASGNARLFDAFRKYQSRVCQVGLGAALCLVIGTIASDQLSEDLGLFSESTAFRDTINVKQITHTTSKKMPAAAKLVLCAEAWLKHQHKANGQANTLKEFAHLLTLLPSFD
jgi:hypothetical protein